MKCTDETHLLAIPEDFKLWYDITKNDTVIGPFRPTSPDVKVEISTDTSDTTTVRVSYFSALENTKHDMTLINIIIF